MLFDKTQCFARIFRYECKNWNTFTGNHRVRAYREKTKIHIVSLKINCYV